MNSSIYSFLFVPYILVDVAYEMQNEKKNSWLDDYNFPQNQK